MARWYGTFNNTTNSTLENSSNRYTRKAFTNGAALQSALSSSRAALSSAMYAQMDAANRNGNNGVVVAQDGYTRGGGTLSWSQLYTNVNAQWQSNPAVRPTAGITVAGSTVVSPADAGSITESLYTDAQQDLEDILSEMGVRARTGANLWRTLASVHFGHDMSYIAWDDYLPGTPTSLGASASDGSPLTTDEVTISLSWSHQYSSDLRDNAQINAELYGGIDNVQLNGQIVTAGASNYVWVIPANTMTSGVKNLIFSVRYRNIDLTTQFGSYSTQYGPTALLTYV